MSQHTSDEMTDGIPDGVPRPLLPGADDASWGVEREQTPAEPGKHLADESLLQHPPSTVDAAEIVEAVDVAPPSRGAVLVTRALVGAILLTGGLAGGTWWAQRSGTTGAATSRSGFPSGAGVPTGMPGAGAASGAASGAGAGAASRTSVAGTVKLVDGTVVYVTTADGSIVRVVTGAKTTVAGEVPAELSDLAAGDKVTVSGSTGSDGSVTATAITEGAR